jgi:hypothetical protein
MVLLAWREDGLRGARRISIGRGMHGGGGALVCMVDVTRPR